MLLFRLFRLNNEPEIAEIRMLCGFLRGVFYYPAIPHGVTDNLYPLKTDPNMLHYHSQHVHLKADHLIYHFPTDCSLLECSS